MEDVSDGKYYKQEHNAFILSGEQKIPTELQMDIVKKESNSFIHTEVDIKIEKSLDERELPVFASSPYEMCPNYDKKIETNEPMVKIEPEKVLDEMAQDPLDHNSEIKVEGDEQHPITESVDEIKYKKKNYEKVDNNLSNKKEPKSSKRRTLLNKNKLLERNIHIEKKKYTCHVCQKIFTWKSSLSVHLRFHTGEKPFECHICKKSFSVKSHLDSHIIIHSGEKPHACDVCDKVFRDKSTLNKHKLIHSGLKPYSCSECNKSFTHKVDLVRHKKIHTGDNLYTCDFCAKAFSQNVTLVQHRRLHTGEKPFTCNICNKSFPQKAGLNYHIKNYKH